MPNHPSYGQGPKCTEVDCYRPLVKQFGNNLQRTKGEKGWHCPWFSVGVRSDRLASSICLPSPLSEEEASGM